MEANDNAYYNSSVDEFLKESNESICGKLSKAAARFSTLFTAQITSWNNCVVDLKTILSSLLLTIPLVKEWTIILEYSIPRSNKRIDVVLLARDLIFVLEFKDRDGGFASEDLKQLQRYCNLLRDFHFESRGKKIVPILWESEGNFEIVDSDVQSDFPRIFLAKTFNLSKLINLYYDRFSSDLEPSISPQIWLSSEYCPTPNIVLATQQIFACQTVDEISHAFSDIESLNSTINFVLETIDAAKAKNEKIVCFVTGVPGAGKTLVGLKVSHSQRITNEGEYISAYFSGNTPLVNVLRESILRDKYEKSLLEYKTTNEIYEAKPKKLSFETAVNSHIQNLHTFIEQSLKSSAEIRERVVVFDEAQRCWSAEKFLSNNLQNRNRKTDPIEPRDQSEAELIFEIMSRKSGWSVIVALVGNGQEINSGEAGISEWINVVSEKYSNWKVLMSPNMENSFGIGDSYLFNDSLKHKEFEFDEKLHLSVSLRSQQTADFNDWVHFTLNNEPEKAFETFSKLDQKFPLYLTRNLSKMKKWLREKKSDEQRIGIIGSSDAVRLRPYGFFSKERVDAVSWFLNANDDIRSSNYLELMATEYAIQGLEIDWVGLCWDGDLRRNDNNWEFKKFRDRIWGNNKNAVNQTYTLNKYRVLLTRAREGMIIWVPTGDEHDITRSSEIYDPIANYLISCGVLEI
jgi:hypothetical protein